MASTNTTIRTVVLKPGERVLIPANAIIKSITTENNITVTSECPLPTPKPFKCYSLKWALSNGDSNSSEPWEYGNGDTDYVGCGYGDQFYPSAIIGGNMEGLILDHIKQSLGTGVVAYGAGSVNNTGSITGRKILIKLPEDIGSDFYLKFSVQHYGPVRVYCETSTECPATVQVESGSSTTTTTSSTTTTTTLAP